MRQSSRDCGASQFQDGPITDQSTYPDSAMSHHLTEWHKDIWVQGDLPFGSGSLTDPLSMPTAVVSVLLFKFVQLLVPRGSRAEPISAIITSINSEGALHKKSLLQFLQKTIPLTGISAFPSSWPIPKKSDEP